MIITLARYSTLDPALPAPLHRQLYDGLRMAILAGRLSAGARLPATRALAAELHVSRNTVLDAYAQLLAEGYVEGKIGSGTYVSRALPDDLLHVRETQDTRPTPAAGRSPRGAARCWRPHPSASRATLGCHTPSGQACRRSIISPSRSGRG